MNDSFFDSVFFDKIFPVIIIIAMILWFYCIWFWNKFDKNTNRLIMLLFLNIYYVPFYFFRIKRIRKENRIQALSDEIYDSDFLEMSRNSIIENLELWTFEANPIEYEMSESDLNPLQYLFEQWEISYRIDKRIIEEAFNETEKELLKTFDKSIITCREKFGDNFPSLAEFQNTNDLKVLKKLAIEIKKEIK